MKLNNNKGVVIGLVSDRDERKSEFQSDLLTFRQKNSFRLQIKVTRCYITGSKPEGIHLVWEFIRHPDIKKGFGFPVDQTKTVLFFRSVKGGCVLDQR